MKNQTFLKHAGYTFCLFSSHPSTFEGFFLYVMYVELNCLGLSAVKNVIVFLLYFSVQLQGIWKRHLIYVFVTCNSYEKKTLCMCIALIFASFLWNSVMHSMDTAFDSIAMRPARYSFCNIFESIWKEISINVWNNCCLEFGLSLFGMYMFLHISYTFDLWWQCSKWQNE